MKLPALFIILAALPLAGCAELLALAAASASSASSEETPAEDAAVTAPATCGTLCAKALGCANVTAEQDFNDCTATCRDGNIQQDQLDGLQALECTELLKALGIAPPAASAPAPVLAAPAPDAAPPR